MSSAEYAYRNSYETTWKRRLRSYHRNEFLARPVTADDREYLERFLKHGPITMETVNTRTGFLLEELGFWHQPYGIDVTVERKVGPPVEEPIIPDADGMADKARRHRNKRDSQLARMTMKEEHDRWKAARETRRLLQQYADAEWERARAEAFSPYAKELELREKYRPLSPRHYVPHWQIEEIAAAEMATAEAEEKKRSATALERIAKKRARDQAEQTAIDLALQAEQEEIERIERQAIEAARRAWEKERGIGGELEAIFDDQLPPPTEEEE